MLTHVTAGVTHADNGPSDGGHNSRVSLSQAGVAVSFLTLTILLALVPVMFITNQM